MQWPFFGCDARQVSPDDLGCLSIHARHHPLHPSRDCPELIRTRNVLLLQHIPGGLRPMEAVNRTGKGPFRHVGSAPTEPFRVQAELPGCSFLGDRPVAVRRPLGAAPHEPPQLRKGGRAWPAHEPGPGLLVLPQSLDEPHSAEPVCFDASSSPSSSRRQLFSRCCL